MTMHIKNLLKKTYPAFSLIEISFVLIIMGILMGAVFKGQDLIENARIQSVVQDAHMYTLAVHSYHDSYGYYPGDDPKASLKFGNDILNGNGDGLIDNNEEQLVWVHLNKAGYVQSQNAPSSKFGGIYTFTSIVNPSQTGLWLKIVQTNGGGVFTPKQAQKILIKFNGHSENLASITNNVIIANGTDTSNSCIAENKININQNEKNCIIYIKIS